MSTKSLIFSNAVKFIIVSPAFDKYKFIYMKFFFIYVRIGRQFLIKYTADPGRNWNVFKITKFIFIVYRADSIKITTE